MHLSRQLWYASPGTLFASSACSLHSLPFSPALSSSLFISQPAYARSFFSFSFFRVFFESMPSFISISSFLLRSIHLILSSSPSFVSVYFGLILHRFYLLLAAPPFALVFLYLRVCQVFEFSRAQLLSLSQSSFIRLFNAPFLPLLPASPALPLSREYNDCKTKRPTPWL